MNSQWTAQDVERFREQQRWRLRHKTHVLPTTHQPIQHDRLFAPTTNNQHDANINANTNTNDRQRKVSLKFRRQHDQFVSKQQALTPLSPHARAMAVTLRPAFAIALPSTQRGPRAAESPLPHTSYSMFNAFDSAASPEAFSLARGTAGNNQDEPHSRGFSADEDHDMGSASGSDSDDSDMVNQDTVGSLWRRRLVAPKRSPKLGRVALWDAAGGMVALDACGGNNQVTEVVRMPLPFANDDDDVL